MRNLDPRFITKTAALYFLLCGLSAIFLPEYWYIVAGVENQSFNLVLSVTGAMMFGIGIGALAAIKFERDTFAVIIVMLIASLADFLVVFSAMLSKELPLLNGGAFLFVDAFWCYLLAKSLKTS